MKTKECAVCWHKNNALNKAPASPLVPIPVTPKMVWRVHVDIAKLPQTQNGNKYIALAICENSKYIQAKGNHPTLSHDFCTFFFDLVRKILKFKSPTTLGVETD